MERGMGWKHLVFGYKRRRLIGCSSPADGIASRRIGIREQRTENREQRPESRSTPEINSRIRKISTEMGAANDVW